ncbi:hypothetical protein EDD15DRAFT_2201932 [Pisolithus albus]|nr:hypothetical protein EDD15DRAFT_2201932 [Pisolithus albus]
MEENIVSCSEFVCPLLRSSRWGCCGGVAANGGVSVSLESIVLNLGIPDPAVTQATQAMGKKPLVSTASSTFAGGVVVESSPVLSPLAPPGEVLPVDGVVDAVVQSPHPICYGLKFGQAVPMNVGYCGIRLLTGESSGFCCGTHGSRRFDVPPLPPLPPQIEALTHHPDISPSRILNLVFSFASLGTTHRFPDMAPGDAFVAIQGHMYHWVQPSAVNAAVQWLLYDSFWDNVPHAQWAQKHC